ncbi:hypothetical protein DB35_13240 [Streptomyces abyssalis]|uniref:Methylamine utilisation protein MauE domain-containing protein n=1 Tax=Streptomyces abyssalis TaxID=933944 RepID=A0A1E7JIP2_9ACTN|nr:hypothetical protein AN215_24745 [Streptomyces abyssalis]OEU93313.1 hypothetical protein DB35_13240 [Streptomyces abyssalis]OEV30540.1 hypothetical protein AN219_10310 [Streptomyces nanshensis]
MRLVLGAVFTAMAVGQLASFGQMPGILAAYGPVNNPAGAVLAVVLITGELVCGVWFLARPRSKAIVPVWVYTGASLIWSTLAVQAFARGLAVENCGCFGVYLSQRLGWLVLVQDALMLLYAAVLLRTAHSGPSRPRRATPPVAAAEAMSRNRKGDDDG